MRRLKTVYASRIWHELGAMPAAAGKSRFCMAVFFSPQEGITTRSHLKRVLRFLTFHLCSPGGTMPLGTKGLPEARRRPGGRGKQCRHGAGRSFTKWGPSISDKHPSDLALDPEISRQQSTSRLHQLTQREHGGCQGLWRWAFLQSLLTGF